MFPSPRPSDNQILEEHGIAVDKNHASHIPAHDAAHHADATKGHGHVEHHSHYHTRHGEDQNKDEGHVIGGYKSLVPLSLSSHQTLFLLLPCLSCGGVHELIVVL
jgi:hypothetical protein